MDANEPHFLGSRYGKFIRCVGGKILLMSTSLHFSRGCETKFDTESGMTVGQELTPTHILLSLPSQAARRGEASQPRHGRCSQKQENPSFVDQNTKFSDGA